MRVPSGRSALLRRALVAGLVLCAWACGGPTAPSVPSVMDTTITASGVGLGGLVFQVASPGHTSVTMTWTNPPRGSVEFRLQLGETGYGGCGTQAGQDPCTTWTGVPTGPTSLVIDADIKTPSSSGGLRNAVFTASADSLAGPSAIAKVPWTMTVTGPGVTCGAYTGDTSQDCH